MENILIETGPAFQRVRLIDFGLSCFAEKTSSFSRFYEWYIHYNYTAGPTAVWRMGAVLYDSFRRKAEFDTMRFIKNELKLSEINSFHVVILSVMAEIVMFEPFELYNLLNQDSCVSRLAEINYLCLIDAREAEDYRTSHIITAKNVKMDSEDTFLLPESVEVDSMSHLVVYDGDTSSVLDEGRAVKCAQVLSKVSLYPVRIVTGGFQRFSALYPFLRTEKIMYTIMELENLKTYPVEVIPGLLYMGDQKQGTDSSILKDLKISAAISISQSDTPESRPIMGNQTILDIPVADSGVSDLYSSFKMICSFIGSHINVRSRVLIVSRQGRSRCSAVTIAFLMHHLKYTLEEAWMYMLKCKPNMRPNTGFVRQLSDWELHTTGKKVTDISEPHF